MKGTYASRVMHTVAALAAGALGLSRIPAELSKPARLRLRCSEFMAGFEQACRDRRIRLFVLPPRSPKLNGHVERAQRTHTEEFYELAHADATVASMGKDLAEWEWTYNHLRFHQSLDYKTPAQFAGITWTH